MKKSIKRTLFVLSTLLFSFRVTFQFIAQAKEDSSPEVLTRQERSHYLVEVSGDQIKLLEICARGNKKNVNSFEKLMNEMYDVNLQY